MLSLFPCLFNEDNAVIQMQVNVKIVIIIEKYSYLDYQIEARGATGLFQIYMASPVLEMFFNLDA